MEETVLGLLRAALGSGRAARAMLRDEGTLRRALEMGGPDVAARYEVPERRARLWEAYRQLRRRAALEATVRGTPLGSPQALHDAAAPLFEGLRRERFYVLPVDAQLQLVSPPVLVGEGGPDHVCLAPRRVFEAMIREDAPGAFLAHNHPSGDPRPSPEDQRLTRRLQELGSALDLRVLDHLVVGRGRSVSVVHGVEVERCSG
jgi:DNA repair protein RadC